MWSLIWISSYSHQNTLSAMQIFANNVNLFLQLLPLVLTLITLAELAPLFFYTNSMERDCRCCDALCFHMLLRSPYLPNLGCTCLSSHLVSLSFLLIPFSCVYDGCLSSLISISKYTNYSLNTNKANNIGKPSSNIQ